MRFVIDTNLRLAAIAALEKFGHHMELAPDIRVWRSPNPAEAAIRGPNMRTDPARELPVHLNRLNVRL
jgi:hypothetical protein